MWGFVCLWDFLFAWVWFGFVCLGLLLVLFDCLAGFWVLLVVGLFLVFFLVYSPAPSTITLSPKPVDLSLAFFLPPAWRLFGSSLEKKFSLKAAEITK